MLPYNKVILRMSTKSFQNTLRASMCTIKAKDEAQIKKMPQELTKETDIATKVELTKMITNKDLEWRTPWHEKEGQHYSFLRTLYTEDSNTRALKILQSPINLSPAAIKKWWTNKQEQKTIWMQQYIPERNQTLGNELAAAHFVVHRGGAIKFFTEDRWIKADEYNQYSLPKRYEADKILQGIDCTRMDLYYEGLVNFRNLRKVEWLSLYDCRNMDDWCIDRISNIFSDTLLYLDIRECPKITDRGLGALYKMKTLKILYVDSLIASKAFELTCLMLQELNPDLDIRTE